MTTTAPFGPNRRVLTVAAVWVLVATAVLVVLAAAIDGSTAALSATVGGVIVLAFFGFGAGVVSAVATLMPDAALMVALLTYTLQVVLVGLVFVVLRGSGLLEDRLSADWLAAGIITGTFGWIVGQLLATVRGPRGRRNQAGEVRVR